MFSSLVAVLALLSILPGSLAAAELTTSEAIRMEATRPNLGGEGRPLPLACHWCCGHFPAPASDGWRPARQIDLIEQGRHLLPSFAHPSPTEPVPGDPKHFFFQYYEGALKRARALRLPIVLVGTQWESLLSQKPYLDLPPDQNPNVITTDGKVLKEVCPFGPVALWREVGRKWSDNAQMKQLQ